jgi:hypothetical protein
MLALVHASAFPAGAQRAPVQPELHAYAVLGLEAVRLRRGARVPSGSVGAVNGSVRLGAATRVSGSVAADLVHVGPEANVGGNLFCRLVTGGRFGSGVVGGPSVQGGAVPGCLTLVTPLVDVTQIAVAAVTPGPDDLVIPPRTGSAPIAAGSYGRVSVGAGALLQLAGGTYEVRSIRLARRARLVCVAECRIGVLEDVVVRPRGQLGASASVRAENVRVDVTTTFDPGFRAGAESVLAATVVVPGGGIVLGRGGMYRGAFIARSVVVGADARVRGDSVF